MAAVLVAVAWSVYDLLKEMAEAGHPLSGTLLLILSAGIIAVTCHDR